MIYLDNAATTAVTEPIFEAMLPYLKENYGNPSSLYSLGRKSKKAIEIARSQVAKAINANPEQIFFTSGATESNNWVVSNFDYVVCSKVEHHSILNNPKCHQIDFSDLANQIYKNNVDLATYMMVNNETGQIFDIKPLVEISHKMGISFHTDATQAFGHIPINVKEINVDSLSLSGHKFHAPKGVGVLYLKEPTRYKSLFHGGHQEKNLRAGTENIAGIVAIGKATELYNYSEAKNNICRKIQNKFCSAFKDIKDVWFNTSTDNAIPTTLNLAFKNVESESLMLLLDSEDIYISSGSACNSGSLEPSHVLKAIRTPEEYIYNSIRLSWDNTLTLENTEIVIESIKKNIEKIRRYV